MDLVILGVGIVSLVTTAIGGITHRNLDAALGLVATDWQDSKHSSNDENPGWETITILDPCYGTCSFAGGFIPAQNSLEFEIAEGKQTQQ